MVDIMSVSRASGNLLRAQGSYAATIGWTVVTVLSIAVGLYAAVFAINPAINPGFIADHGEDYNALFVILHVALAAPTLILGPFQFMRGLRRHLPRLHRLSGYIYVVCALASAAASFVAAQDALVGPSCVLGFSLLALCWGYSTAMAVFAARRRDFAEHEMWMKRSFALTFAAVTLRLQMGVGMAMDMPFDDIYRIIAFGCWVPNLIIAEWFWVRRTV